MSTATNAAGEPIVRVERRARVGIVRFNRPEARNAMNGELTVAIADAIDEFESDDEVWVLIVTGTGTAFSAGADLKAAASSRPRGANDRPRRDLGGFAGITRRRFVKPVIAAVNGYALGGGTEICLACDLVVAEEQAEFGLPEVRRGIIAGAGGIQRLPRRVPPAIAMEIILTGKPVTAARAAFEIGLINRVVPMGTCVEAAVELAEIICEAAPLSVRYSKAVARASFSIGEEDAFTGLDEMRQMLLESEDFREGPRAFAEKRPPVWKAR